MSNDVAKNLLDLKERSGKSYRTIAAAAGLGETAVRDIIVGRSRSPKLETLDRIARALDVRLVDVLGTDGRIDGLLEDPGAGFLAITDAIDGARNALARAQEDRTIASNEAARDLMLAQMALIRACQAVVFDEPAMVDALTTAIETAERKQLPMRPEWIARLAATLYEARVAERAGRI